MLKAGFFFQDQRVYSNSRKIENPKVSVVLPTYARGDNGLLARSIESVLSQSYADFELLVIDDGSTDGTSEVVATYVRQDSRVVHVRHDINSGLPALRVNEGLLLAKGKYFAYQFDDDQWTPDSLKRRVEILDQNTEFAVVYGLARARWAGQEADLGKPFSYDELIEGNYIANNTVVHRRETFESHGGYDMHLVMRRLCDWDLWLRWAKYCRFYFLDEVVSLVDADLENSLGRTVQYDIIASRFQMAHDRNFSLTPTALREYSVDGLERFRALGDHRVDEIWREHVAPYRARHRNLWAAPKNFIPRKSNVVVTKARYDTNVDITIYNLAEYLGDQYVFTFVPSAQMTNEVLDGADLIVFHRTIDEHAEALQKKARLLGKCTIFLMDDDLLSMYELDQTFSYLAPGSAGYECVVRQMKCADLTIVYSPLMEESARLYSKRVVRLSTNIDRKWLISELPLNNPLRIGFAGSAARKEEWATLLPALLRISQKYKSAIEFHFWGFKPENLPQLESPVFFEPFTYSYSEYLSRLTSAHFDIMLAPLHADKRAKQAKCPIKFLEATAAGALGLYSDVEPYSAVEDGVNGIKCQNSPESWEQSLSRAIDLSVAERHTYVDRARARVITDFLSEVQAGDLAAALEAARLQSLIGDEERTNPNIAFVFHSPYQGGAENHLLRHARLAAEFGFKPLAVFPTGNENADHEIVAGCRESGIPIDFLPLRVETEPVSRDFDRSAVEAITRWLRKKNIRLVHSVTLIQELGKACADNGIPHVASLYAVETKSIGPALSGHCDIVHSDSLLYANAWARLLGVRARCIRSHVPRPYFEQGARRAITGDNGSLHRVGIFGTVQTRKGQLQAIEAVGRLKGEHGIHFELHIYGYTQFFKEYMEECERAAEKFDLAGKVHFHGFLPDTAEVLSQTDITLCASDWESLPQVILESMAADVMVVAPNVGGISEIVSNNCGVLIKDNSVEEIMKGLLTAYKMPLKERRERIALAQKVVTAESSRGAVARSLFRAYADAVQVVRGAGNLLTAPATQHSIGSLRASSVELQVHADVTKHRMNARSFAKALLNT